jgi:hypothetical protein
MALGDDDLDVFFAEFAIPVVFNGKAAKGIFDAPGADSVFGEASVAGLDIRVLLPVNAFPVMPVGGDALTVGGNAFKVRKTNPLDDGAFIELKLKGT